MKIIVDADACPRAALQICQKVAHVYDLSLLTVANFNHIIQSDQHIIVDNSSQEADIQIMNLAQAGDVVVTQDWGLAAMLLAKKANCLHPKGMEYNEATIGFLLEERELKAKFRREGGRTKGPKKRSKTDDQKFEACLLSILSKYQR